MASGYRKISRGTGPGSSQGGQAPSASGSTPAPGSGALGLGDRRPAGLGPVGEVVPPAKSVLSEAPAEESHLWAPSGRFPTAEDRARRDGAGTTRTPPCSAAAGQATQVVSQGRHHHSFLRLVRVPSLSGL